MTAPTYAAWQLENKKAEFMEWLYRVYDRDNDVDGVRGTYTGLWAAFQRDLAHMYRDGLMHAAIDKDMSIEDLAAK